MQKAETVLSILRQKSEHDEKYVFERVYRNLFNEDFFIRAYQKIHAKEGNMTPGADSDTIDGFNKKQVAKLIELLKMEKYQPKPVRRTYIPKKNGKMRPLGIPTFTDKLVQEVVRQILEAIYEPIFCDTSHGFRPNRSCHAALYQVKSTCKGTNWVIEGDITAFFENVDHDILISILSKKVQEGRLLELIRRFLKAGYFEFEEKHNTLSGTPQGGIISPILAKVMERRVRGNSHARCGAGENPTITSRDYLSLLLCFDTDIDAEKFCNEKSALFIVNVGKDQKLFYILSLQY